MVTIYKELEGSFYILEAEIQAAGIDCQKEHGLTGDFSIVLLTEFAQ